MTTQLAVRPQEELGRRDRFTAEETEIIKNNIMPGATNAELDLFYIECYRTGLDPFAKQIYSIRRKKKIGNIYKEVWATQIAVDGFRLIAERSNRYAGQALPLFCGKDGVWKEVWPEKTPPFACKVGVYKQGFAEPLRRVCKWDEYVVTYDGDATGQWRDRPCVMLSKVTECAALRAAFPNELGGLYAAEEGITDDDIPEVSTKPTDTGKSKVQSLAERVKAQNEAAQATSNSVAKAENAQTSEVAQSPIADQDDIKRVSDALKPYKMTHAMASNILGHSPKKPAEWTVEDVEKLEQFIADHPIAEDEPKSEDADDTNTAVAQTDDTETAVILNDEQRTLMDGFVSHGGKLEMLANICNKRFKETPSLEHAFSEMSEAEAGKIAKFVAAKAKSETAE